MVRALIQLAWLFGAFVAVCVLVEVAPAVRRRVRTAWIRWRAKRACPVAALSLRVAVDERTGSLQPTVLLRGDPSRRKGTIRLELVDEHRKVQFACVQAIPPYAIGTEIPLPPLLPPEGVHHDDVLRWRWDVTIDLPGRRPARWSEYLLSTERFDAEAQIAARI